MLIQIVPDLSYRQAMVLVARNYLSRVLPADYSPNMTDDEVVDLLTQVVEQIVSVYPLIDEFRNIGLLPGDGWSAFQS